MAYIKSWQKVLNEVAAQNGLVAFQFNSYIISVFVIFFLKMNKNFPKMKDLPASRSKCIERIGAVKNESIKQAISQFFEFYGTRYEINNHLISVNIGRWQEQRLQAQQTKLTPEQKRFVKVQ